MATTKSQYICNACGASSARWLGKCPSCNAWNSLEEVAAAPAGTSKNRLSNAPQALAGVSEVATLADIKAEEVARTPTGLGELDRVLGGGMVAGGVVLIGGDPGIGKSTLLLQALDALQLQGLQTLYVTGEKAPLKSRCARAGWGWKARRCGCWRKFSSKKFWPPCRLSTRKWRWWTPSKPFTAMP